MYGWMDGWMDGCTHRYIYIYAPIYVDDDDDVYLIEITTWQ
jgi:hypothetical protein